MYMYKYAMGIKIKPVPERIFMSKSLKCMLRPL